MFPNWVSREREDLLDDLMSALNALTDAGCPVTPVAGQLETPAGAVIPGRDGRWRARPLITSTPSTRPPLPEYQRDDW